MLAAFLACACIISRWYFSVASSNSSSGQWLLCILCMHLRLSSWFCLVQHSNVGAHMLSSISPPSSPYSGESGPLLYSFFFPLNSLFSVMSAWSRVWCGGRGSWLGCRYCRAGLWGVPPTWVWVVGTSPQILEYPTSICKTGVNTV